MNYADKLFENLKSRYIKYLRYSKHKFLENSRNEKKAIEYFGLSFLLTSKLDLDEFSLRVSDQFLWMYDLGRSIDDILYILINDIRVKYLEEISRRPEDKTIKIRKTFWRIPLPFVKYFETYDYKGELTSRFIIKYNYTRENLIKLYEAKTSDEKKLIFSFLILQREYLYQKPITLTNQIVSPEVSDKRKWLKALVKYIAKREFSTELYTIQLKPEEQKIVTETKERRKKGEQKPVKWTDGRKKNNFPKLIYALHKSGFLENGEGEITKIVEQLAPAFALELGDWESNLSKHINDTKNGYDYSAFFESLKDSFQQIVAERRINGK